MKAASEDDTTFRHETYLILDDRTFYRARYPRRALDDFGLDWSNFQRLEVHAREAIVDALLEDKEARRFMSLRYVEKPIDEFLAEKNSVIQSELAEQS